MFSGFTAADFDAYAPNKWKSNVFNRERLEVRQKLLALSALIGGKLIDADGAPLLAEASAEHPALWNHKQVDVQQLFFSRNAEARKELDAIIDRKKSMASLIEDPTPQRNHLFLAVAVSQNHLEVALRLHPDAAVDKTNFIKKCQDHFEQERLVLTVQSLDANFLVAIGTQIQPASEFSAETAAEILQKLEGQSPSIGKDVTWFSIFRRYGRDEMIVAGENAVTVLESTLKALLGLYHFAAWARENDYVSMRETLQKEKQAKRQKGLQANDRVRVVRGMFSGKTGTVQQVDPKGNLKVLIGKMAVKVDAADVIKA